MMCIKKGEVSSMMVKNLKPFGPNKEENIQRVEKGEKVKFPADYREFLLTVGGGIFPQVRNPNAGPEDNVLYDLKPVAMHGISEGKEFADYFEVLMGCLRNGNRKYDIESELRTWDGSEEAYENPNKYIPIGWSQYGNTLIMELNDKYYGNIVYLDHECLFDESYETQDSAYLVAETFTEFLELMNDEDRIKNKGRKQ